MKISELAKQTNVPAKTIRYYENVGLLAPPTRANNGYRVYQDNSVKTLIFIRRCRELKISIDEIKQLVEAKNQPSSSCQYVDNIIAQQLENIRKAQQELAKLEQSLATLANSCGHGKVIDCEILNELHKN
ncbi:MAG: Cd(II)/Pb(II)-responsive transcriptional regulator [Pseudoalteromonas sp.]|uniref:Cd(II)/Pb(II)-responsive transcriptional regulator n=1 Tax=unclassified Pseudoalteromonas TaxID=194690 RepID=UPI003F9BBAA3